MFGNRRGKRVLLVDDEPDITTVLSMALQEFDYDVKTAKSVDEAIDIFEEWDPQFIVSDYAMPIRTGWISFITCGTDGRLCGRKTVCIFVR